MAESIYDDINYCLELLYNSIYSTKTDECYAFNNINKKDIIIDEIGRAHV